MNKRWSTDQNPESLERAREREGEAESAGRGWEQDDGGPDLVEASDSRAELRELLGIGRAQSSGGGGHWELAQSLAYDRRKVRERERESEREESADRKMVEREYADDKEKG